MSATLNAPATQEDAVRFALEHELDPLQVALAVMQRSPVTFLGMAKVDLNAFVATLIKTDPAGFVSIGLQLVAKVQNIQQIKEFMLAGNLIGAIKVVRSDTGIGLKEAKDVVVYARDVLNATKKLAVPPGPPGSVTAALQSAALSVDLLHIANAIICSFS